MIGIFFWPFFGAGLGGENVLGQNSDAQVGPSLQNLRGEDSPPKFGGRSSKNTIKEGAPCFESTVSGKRTHGASLSFGANSVSSAKRKLGEFALAHK